MSTDMSSLGRFQLLILVGCLALATASSGREGNSSQHNVSLNFEGVAGKNGNPKTLRPRNLNLGLEESKNHLDGEIDLLDGSWINFMYLSHGESYGKHVKRSSESSGQPGISKDENFVAYKNQPPIRSRSGELLYYPVNYHIIAQLEIKGLCKVVPSIPRNSSFELEVPDRQDMGENLFQHKISSIVTCTDSDIAFMKNIFKGPGSYVFVENPNFNLSYKNPFAYIPDTDPTAYIPLLDMVRQEELIEGDHEVYAAMVPWPKIDLDRMLRFKEIQPTLPGPTDLKLQTETLEETENKEIERLLQEFARESHGDFPDIETLTKECDDVQNSTECPDITKAQKLGACACTSKKRSKVLCCDFKGRAGSYSVDFQKDLTIFITNASPLMVASSDRSVKKIFIHNSTVAEVDTNGTPTVATELHIANCEANAVPVARITTISNSKVGFISERSTALKKFSLFHSTVVLMEDLKVADDEKENFLNLFSETESERQDVGFRVEASKIQHFNNVTLMCTAVMYSCTIERVVETSAHEMYISGSNIHSVHPKGLAVAETLTLINTRIGHLHRDAIMTQARGTLYLKNVVIEQCDQPCFFTNPDTRLVLENVVINGRLVEDQGGTRNDQLTSNPRRTVFPLEMRDVCHVEYFFWDCDMFSFAEEPLDFSLRKDIFEYITIRNHPNISISEGCFRNITLSNINGFFYHLMPQEFNSFSVSCELQSQLEIKNSSLTILLSRRVGQFRATEGLSSVQYLDLGGVTRFQSTNLNIGVLEHLELRPSHPKVASFITDARIGLVHQFAISTPTKFSNVTFGEVQALVVNHFTELEAPTVISSSSFNLVHPGGIRVLSGKLMMLDVRFKNPKENMLYLADRTQLLIHGDVTDSPLNCSHTGPIISAVSRKQVLYLDAATPSWLWDCVNFHKAAVAKSVHHDPLDAQLAHMKIINPAKDCWTFESLQILCDFRNIKTLIQLGGTNALDFFKSATVKNVENLTVGDHCLQEIILEFVKSYFITQGNDSCFHNLHLYNSKMFIIEANVVELNISHSFVTHVSLPNKLRQVQLDNSQVQEMFLIVDSGVMRQAQISTIKKLVVRNNLRIEESLVSETLNNSIVVMPGASLVLNNTRVANVPTGAIHVFGNLILSNSVFSRAFNGSIFVWRGGAVKVNKLRILYCASACIKTDDSRLNRPESASVKVNVTIRSAEYTYHSISKNDCECDFLQAIKYPANDELPGPSIEEMDVGTKEVVTNLNKDVVPTENTALIISFVVVAIVCGLAVFGFMILENLGYTHFRDRLVNSSPVRPSSPESDINFETFPRRWKVPKHRPQLPTNQDERSGDTQEREPKNSTEEPDSNSLSGRQGPVTHADTPIVVHRSENLETCQVMGPDRPLSSRLEDTESTIENEYEEQNQAQALPLDRPRASVSHYDSDLYAADAETSIDTGCIRRSKSFYRNEELAHLSHTFKGKHESSLSSEASADDLKQKKMYFKVDSKVNQGKWTTVIHQREEEFGSEDFDESNAPSSEPLAAPNNDQTLDPTVVSVRPKIRNYNRREQHREAQPENSSQSTVNKISFYIHSPTAGETVKNNELEQSPRTKTTEFKRSRQFEDDEQGTLNSRNTPQSNLTRNSLGAVEHGITEHLPTNPENFSSLATSNFRFSSPPVDRDGIELSDLDRAVASGNPKQTVRNLVRELEPNTVSPDTPKSILRVRDSVEPLGASSDPTRPSSDHSTGLAHPHSDAASDDRSSEGSISSVISAISYLARSPRRVLDAVWRPTEGIRAPTTIADVHQTQEESENVPKDPSIERTDESHEK